MESAKYLHYKKKVSRGGSYLLKVLLGIFISAPIIICLMLALKQPGEFLTAKAAHLISEDPTLDNFKWIMDNVAVGTYLKNTLIQCTIVIVAQRINTIMDADQSLVLDEGRIVGRGTHSQLLKQCGVYQEIALSQLSEEELERGRQQ